MKKALLLSALFAGVAVAQTTEERIRQLEEQIRLLQQEIQRLKEEQKKTEEVKQETEAIKEEIRKLRLEIAMPELELKSYSGLGPAASKALSNPKGVSIGGYGEGLWEHYAQDKGKRKADYYRLILYLGYAFTEKLKFNSEIEFEHATTKTIDGKSPGYAAVELAMLDYNFSRAFGVRGGLLLVPVGIINEIHEPPTFPSANRPFFERRIIPSTWRENGLGIYGETDLVSYRFYVLNPMRVGGDGAPKNEEPIKQFRQNGAEALNNGLAYTGRLDFKLPYNLTVGGSFFVSDILSDGNYPLLQVKRGDKVGKVTMLSPHLWWQYAGFDVRVVGAFANVSDAKKLTQTVRAKYTTSNYVAPKSFGGYSIQVAYNILRHFYPDQELYLFGIYENYDTHKSVPEGYLKPQGHKVRVYNFGLSYKPHPLVALKADYVKYDPKDKKKEDIYRFAFGFMF